jgi:S-ribosylhomocysteine lyase LuxS involved in autoinducer biosynthesis
LDTISKKFGTQIQIISDTTPEGMKWFAKVDNGTVLINMALKPENQLAENYILEKSLHEFAHLFLTAFRIQYPDQYVQMVKALPSSLNMGSFYTTTAANLDEFLVDVLMEMIKTDATNNPDSQEVLKIFNTALERIVN